MKRNWLKSAVLMLALLGVVFASFGAVSPVFAQDVTPPAPEDPGVAPDQAVTQVIPDTGGDTTTDNDGFFLSGWSLLIILGVLVMVLLIALLARSGHTHV